MLTIEHEWPPNIVYIRQFLPVDLPETPPLFCYSPKLYAPNYTTIPEDVIFHEGIHERQQNGDPEVWWVKYCTSAQFRLEQELEAYAAQYLWIRKRIAPKAAIEAIEEMAANLSSPLYQLALTHNQAKIAIGRKVKEVQ